MMGVTPSSFSGQAQVDGEMALAEGLCYNKIDMLEHKTNLLQRKFTLINEEQAWLEKAIRDVENKRCALSLGIAEQARYGSGYA